MVQSTYQIIERLRSSSTFAGHYHHYSEGLFIKAAAFLSEGDIAVDAGCYLADNAIAFAKAVGESGRVFTFEPDPRLFAKATDRILANPEFQGRILLSDYALGERARQVEFLIADNLEGHSDLIRKNDYGTDVTLTPITRSLLTLDYYLGQQSVAPAKLKAIKFDLEGGELAAFRGARKSIEAGQPIIMF